MAARQKKSPRRRKTTATRKRAKRPAQARSRPQPASLGDRLTELVEHAASGVLRRVVDTGGREIGAWLPDAGEMRREAGAYLRELRELAGLTIDELTDAVELSDRSLLEAVEAGTATLSFELVLRLAAILARHDQDWGVGRLPLQLEREREFVNLLRGYDEARALSDEDFEKVLAFTRAAFETALHFAAKSTRSSE
jgi:transcriptional regulator with XRE-family HTH domain